MTNAAEQVGDRPKKPNLKLVVNNDAKVQQPPSHQKCALIRNLEKMTKELDEEIDFIFNL